MGWLCRSVVVEKRIVQPGMDGARGPAAAQAARGSGHGDDLAKSDGFNSDGFN
jgi:hypothetical protein